MKKMEKKNSQKEEIMPESASSPISHEISASTDNNATAIPPSTSQSSPPPASASTAIDPSQHSDSSPPLNSPSANSSSSNSTTQPDPGGGQSSSLPNASSAPPPLNKASYPPPPPPPLPPPSPPRRSPPPSPATFLPPNNPPSSPIPSPSESNPVFSPPPQPPSISSPVSKASSPPAAPILSPPPTREPPNLSQPVQVVTPSAPVTPSIPAPPDSLIPINISPPKPSIPDAPIPQSIPDKPTSSTSSGGKAPTNTPQGNSISTNGGSSAIVRSSSHVSPSNGVVIAATVCGAVIAFIAILLVVLVKRKRRMNGLKEKYRPTSDGSTKRTDEQLQRKVSNLGELNLQLVGYDVSGSPLSPSAGKTSYESNGDYGYFAGSADAAGTRPCFTYEDLMGITKGFSQENKIGEGGFGSVFRGCLPDGRTVAVKQLKVGSGQGEREFRAEVEIISRIHHRHLVSLVGYCISEHHRLLVYEFVPNKTLEHHLHGKDQIPLDWQKRIKIALGSARGLVYLHEYCHPRIIHRDIKSANILLDDSFEAKVADFGLAKLANDTSTHVSTRVVGTFGYMAPEYAASGKLTQKSDVFSFGVVLLELVAGRKPVDISRPQGEESLVEWARPLLVHAIETGDCEELVDPKLGNNFPNAEMLRMIEVAASCVRHSAVKRPSMAQVLRAFENNEDVSDISNGVKIGESVAYNSGQYSADIRRFQRLAFGTPEFSSGFGPSKE